MMKCWIVMKYKRILFILSLLLFFPFDYSNGEEGKFAKITWCLIFLITFAFHLLLVISWFLAEHEVQIRNIYRSNCWLVKSANKTCWVFSQLIFLLTENPRPAMLNYLSICDCSLNLFGHRKSKCTYVARMCKSILKVST